MFQAMSSYITAASGKAVTHSEAIQAVAGSLEESLGTQRTRFPFVATAKLPKDLAAVTKKDLQNMAAIPKETLDSMRVTIEGILMTNFTDVCSTDVYIPLPAVSAWCPNGVRIQFVELIPHACAFMSNIATWQQLVQSRFFASDNVSYLIGFWRDYFQHWGWAKAGLPLQPSVWGRMARPAVHGTAPL